MKQVVTSIHARIYARRVVGAVAIKIKNMNAVTAIAALVEDVALPQKQSVKMHVHSFTVHLLHHRVPLPLHRLYMEQIRRAVKANVKKRIIVAITTSLEDRIKNCRVYRPAWFVFLVFLNLSVTLHVPLMVVPSLASHCALRATMSLLILLILGRTISLLQAGPALIIMVQVRTRA